MMNLESKKLYRSRDVRMIGGVCTGLGAFFSIDPTVIRLIFVLALFTWPGPFMALVYLLLLIVVPEEPISSTTVVEPPTNLTIDAP